MKELSLRRGLGIAFSNLPHRPAGALSKNLVLAESPGFKLRQKIAIAAVTHGKRNISVQSFPTCSLQGRAFEASLKVCRVETGQPCE